jgi:hypothetical protein
MNLESLIAKYQARAAAYTHNAQPYVGRNEKQARAWFGRALEAEEIVRDLTKLQEAEHAVLSVSAKARSNRRRREEGEGTGEGAEGSRGEGDAGAAGTPSE